MNGRYTPKRSVEARRQSWAALNETQVMKLNPIGRVLHAAALEGPKRFEQVMRELVPEVPPSG